MEKVKMFFRKIDDNDTFKPLEIQLNSKEETEAEAETLISFEVEAETVLYRKITKRDRVLKIVKGKKIDTFKEITLAGKVIGKR